MRKHELNEGKLAGNVRWVKSWIEQGLSREEAHKKAKIYTIHPMTVDDLYNQARSWQEARYESVKANYRFHRQIEELLGVEKPLQLLSMQHKHLKRDIT